MDNLAKYIDEERDVGFLIGIEKGIEKGIERGAEKAQIKFIAFLLKEGQKTFDQIADIVGVTTDFVKMVKKQQLSAN